VPIFFGQKITMLNCKHMKTSKTLSHEKAVRKLLLKLTPILVLRFDVYSSPVFASSLPLPSLSVPLS